MWSMPEAGPAMRPTVTTPTPWCQGWTTVSWILERVFPLYPIISLLFLDNAPISVGQNQIILPSRIHMSLLLESIQRLHTLAPVFLLLSQNKGCRAVGSLLLFPRFWIIRICHEWSMIIWRLNSHVHWLTHFVSVPFCHRRFLKDTSWGTSTVAASSINMPRRLLSKLTWHEANGQQTVVVYGSIA